MSTPSDRRSVTLHQQDGGMSVQAFADQEGLTPQQVVRCAKDGKILGACKTHGNKWLIYPPAKLQSRPRTYGKRLKEPRRPAALPDPLAAVAPFGQSGSDVAAVGSGSAECLDSRPPADGVCGCAAALPAPFASPDTAAACQCLSEAAARVPAQFVLELSEPMLLWAWGAAHRDLGKLLDDVKKGRCLESDTRHARALYNELSKLVYSRMPERKRASNGGGLEAAFWLSDSDREEILQEVAP